MAVPNPGRSGFVDRLLDHPRCSAKGDYNNPYVTTYTQPDAADGANGHHGGGDRLVAILAAMVGSALVTVCETNSNRFKTIPLHNSGALLRW